MSLISISSRIAVDVGVERPEAVVGATDDEAVDMKEATEQAANELARRVDWGQLTASIALVGDGTNQTYDMPDGFSRIISGIGVVGTNIVRPITRAEWNALTPIEGTPRYFLLEDDQLMLWPYLSSGATVTVTYQSANWCSNESDQWSGDSDTSLIDEKLIEQGGIVRWRRQKGMPYADHEAEYEAALSQIANFNERNRL